MLLHNSGEFLENDPSYLTKFAVSAPCHSCRKVERFRQWARDRRKLAKIATQDDTDATK